LHVSSHRQSHLRRFGVKNEKKLNRPQAYTYIHGVSPIFVAPAEKNQAVSNVIDRHLFRDSRRCRGDTATRSLRVTVFSLCFFVGYFFCVAVGSERCIQIAAAYFFTLHTYGRIWIAANFLNLCGIRRVFRNSESDVTRFDFHRKPESHTYVCAHVQREAAVVEWSSKRCIISTAT
jgi:hypothetical protein